MKKCNLCSKVFLLDIQVPFDNFARLSITHIAADSITRPNEETSSNVYTCMSVNYSLIKKDFQSYVEMCDKTFHFVSACYTH